MLSQLRCKQHSNYFDFIDFIGEVPTANALLTIEPILSTIVLITNILNDEDNVAVFIYISDEAADPIHLQMGNGENELVINVEETGIKYVWTKKTYWKMTTDFLKNVVNTIVDRIGSIVSI
jgi:hypothetical protein